MSIKRTVRDNDTEGSCWSQLAVMPMSFSHAKYIHSVSNRKLAVLAERIQSHWNYKGKFI